MDKDLLDFTEDEYNKFSSSGLMWEIFPNAPETYDNLLKMRGLRDGTS